MSRLLIVLVIAVSGVASVPAGAGTDALSFIQVVDKEWTVTPSRPKVRAGSVGVELVNFGMDNHDLVIQGMKPRSKAFRFKQLSPRTRTERTLRLSVGRYTLWCSLPGHKARGMRATLVVTR